MANTYVKIATNTVGVLGATSVSFTSIPNTYTDLLIKVSARDTGDNSSAIGFNGGTPTGYTTISLEGTGSAVGSATRTGTGSVVGYTTTFGGRTASVFSNTEIYIPNYNSSANKSFSTDGVEENNATASFQKFFAGIWSNTNAITSVQLVAVTLFPQYSSFTLYGISKS
jgi:hypothetical protein